MMTPQSILINNNNSILNQLKNLLLKLIYVKKTIKGTKIQIGNIII